MTTARLLVLIAIVTVATIAASCGGDDEQAGSAGGGSDRTVVVANFGGIVAETTRSAFSEPFIRDTGIQVQSIAVPGGFAARLQAQRQANDISWDAIEGVDGPSAALLNREGLLAPIPEDLRREIDAVSLPNAVTEYGVALGDTGVIIACNMERVDRCPRDPAQFWNVQAFPGRRAMPDVPLETLATALVADGVPVDEVFPMDVDRAFRKLEQIKPSIAVWTTSGDQQMQVMRSGEAPISVMWNGRAKSLQDEGLDVEMQWDGSLVNPNYLVVIEGGPNPDAGFEYMRWYATHPEAQARFARRLAYGTSHEETVGLLDDSDAAALPTSDENSRRQVRIEPEWWVEHSSQVEPRWREFLAR